MRASILTVILLNVLHINIFSQWCGTIQNPPNPSYQNNEGSFPFEGYLYSDRFGNLYTYDDLCLPENYPANQNNLEGASMNMNCTAGIFDLYFVDSGNLTISQAQKEVICAAFEHLSSFFDISNLSSNVNIEVEPISIAPTAQDVTLGTGSPMYDLGTNCKIKDSEIQRILIGQDETTGIIQGVYQVNVHENVVYDMSTEPNQTCGFAGSSLFAVSLHEGLHILGFSSVISENGVERSWYTRWDQHLISNKNEARLLIHNEDDSCSSSHDFNNNEFPNMPEDAMLCENEIYFKSYNNNLGNIAPVNTDYGLQNWPNEISHLNAQCLGNDEDQYLMHGFQTPGICDLHPDELLILCELGYPLLNFDCEEQCNINAVDDIFTYELADDNIYHVNVVDLISNDLLPEAFDFQIESDCFGNSAAFILDSSLPIDEMVIQITSELSNVITFCYSVSGCSIVEDLAYVTINIDIGNTSFADANGCNIALLGDFNSPASGLLCNWVEQYNYSPDFCLPGLTHGFFVDDPISVGNSPSRLTANFSDFGLHGRCGFSGASNISNDQGLVAGLSIGNHPLNNNIVHEALALELGEPVFPGDVVDVLWKAAASPDCIDAYNPSLELTFLASAPVPNTMVYSNPGPASATQSHPITHSINEQFPFDPYSTTFINNSSNIWSHFLMEIQANTNLFEDQGIIETWIDDIEIYLQKNVLDVSTNISNPSPCLGEIVIIDYEICNNREYILDDITLSLELPMGLEIINASDLTLEPNIIESGELSLVSAEPLNCITRSLAFRVINDTNLYGQLMSISLNIDPGGCNLEKTILTEISIVEMPQEISLDNSYNVEGQLEVTVEVANNADVSVDDLLVGFLIPEDLTIIDDGGFDFDGNTGIQSISIGANGIVSFLLIFENEGCHCETMEFSASIANCFNDQESLSVERNEFYLNNQFFEYYSVNLSCTDFFAGLLNPSPCNEYEWTIEGVGVISGNHINTDLSLHESTIALNATTPCGDVEGLEFEVLLDDDCLLLNLECIDNGTDFISIDNMTIAEVMSEHSLTSDITDRIFYVSDELVIDEQVDFESCTFYFAEDAELIIQSGFTNFSANTLLTACNYLWKGVKLENSGKMTLNNSVIEFAEVGIETSVDQSFIPHATNYSQIKDCIIGVKVQNTSNFHMNWNSEIHCTNRMVEYNASAIKVYGVQSLNSEVFVQYEASIHDTNLGIQIIGDNEEFRSNAIVGFGASIYNIHGDLSEVPSPFAAIHGNNAGIALYRRSEIYNVEYGIYCDNSFLSIWDNQRIEAETFAIAGWELKYARISNNDLIESKGNTIVLSGHPNDLASCTVNHNTIKAKCDQDCNGDIINSFGLIAQYTRSRIFNNDIEIENGKTGIQATFSNDIEIEENDIKLNNSNISGITLWGGEKQRVTCNEIRSETETSDANGISIKMASDTHLIDNTLEGVNIGIQFDENSSMHTIQKNQFISGENGIETNSMLGPQPYHGNIWKRNAWDRDAVSSLAVDQNSFMQFTVNPLINDWSCDNNIPSGYVYNPENVSNNWFFARDEFCNLQYGDCLVDIAGPGDEFAVIDALEAICNSIKDGKKAGLDCSESWVSSFELFSLIKHLDVKPSEKDHACLSQFAIETDSTLLESFYQIDSILYSGLDSLANHTIDSLYNNLYDHIDEHGYEDVDSLFSEIVDFTVAQDSIRGIKSLQIDSILIQVIPDSCAVTQAFKDVYSFMNKGISIDSLSRDLRSQQMLHKIAMECPKRFGHIVYVARSYMRFISKYDYESIKCDDRTIDKRERSEPHEIASTSIYPNPTQVYFTLEALHIKDGSVEIYDVSSRRVKLVTHFSQLVQVDVKGLLSGVYFVKILNRATAEYEVQKIIIQ